MTAVPPRRVVQAGGGTNRAELLLRPGPTGVFVQSTALRLATRTVLAALEVQAPRKVLRLDVASYGTEHETDHQGAAPT